MLGPRSLLLELAPVAAHYWLALVALLMVEPFSPREWLAPVTFPYGWPL